MDLGSHYGTFAGGARVQQKISFVALQNGDGFYLATRSIDLPCCCLKKAAVTKGTILPTENTGKMIRMV